MTTLMILSMLPGHPRARTLDGFAHGALDARARTRVAAHLEHCARCRRIVTSDRAILEMAARSSSPEPRRKLLERALARRTAGERVILPADAPPAGHGARRRTMTSAVIAATLALGVALALMTRSNDVLAGDSDGVLHVAPALPHPGNRIGVEYDAPATFAHESRLALRVRLLTPEDEAYQPGRYMSVLLAREGGDRFVGSFTLPDSAVYAAMAVEDTSGERIDTHANQLWEILTTTDGRAPSYDALTAQENAWMGRSWEAGYAAAQQATRLYPDNPRSWYTLCFYQQFVLAAAALDSLRPLQRARLATFHRRLAARRAVPGDLMGVMYFYAWTLGDSAKKAYWGARLEREAPANPFTIQNRLGEFASTLWRRDSVAALAAYEALWRDVAGVPGALEHQGRMLPRMGLDAAVRLHDVAATKRWAARVVAVSPRDSFSVASRLADNPALRDTALAWMRRRIAASATPDVSERALWRTRREQTRRAGFEYGQMLGRYGEILLRIHEWRRAADTLDRAASFGWRPDLMRAAADAHLALGDTASALRLLAGLVADPQTPDSARARIEALVARVHAPAWPAWTDSAARRMREFVLAGGTNKPLREDIRLRAAGGDATESLTELRRGHAAVVVFWSAHCGPALEAVPAIEQLRQRLGPSGTPVIVVSEDSLSAEDRATVHARGGTFPVYVDEGHRAQRAFSNFGTPAFYVLDDAGHVRFEWAQPQDMVRDLSVLGSAQVSERR